MKIGVCAPNYGETCSKEALCTFASEAEKLGFHSIWCTDHLLMSRNSGTPYERIFESMTTLSYLAAITTKLRLGISSLITPMRNPVIIAKQLATIDVLSQGRIMLATSVGWNEAEFGNLGSNFHNRGKRLDDSLRLFRGLWSGQTSFQSKVLPQRYQDAVFEPSPMKKLSIWIAGNSMAAMKRAASLGDGWHPNVQPLDRFAQLVSDFRNGFQEADKKKISVRIGFNSKATTSEYLSPQGERRIMLSSNRLENKKIVERLESLGVSYMVLAPSPDGKASVNDQLDALRMIAEDFL